MKQIGTYLVSGLFSLSLTLTGVAAHAVYCPFDDPAALGADASVSGRVFANEGEAVWSEHGVRGGCARFCGKGPLALKALPGPLKAKRAITISFWFRFPPQRRATLVRRNFEYGFFALGKPGKIGRTTWACAGAKSRHDRTATPETLKDHWFVNAYGGAGLTCASGLYEAVTDRRWHQAVFTVDPETRVRRTYVDGVCRGEARGDWPYDVAPDGQLWIGASFWGKMDGWMDEFKIEDRALAADEIASAWAARPRAKTDVVPPDSGDVPERELTVREPWWLLPIDSTPKAKKTHVNVYDRDGTLLAYYAWALAPKGDGDWTSVVDVRRWLGKTVTLELVSAPDGFAKPLERVRPSATAPQTAFDEPDRLKFHFTPPRGFMNDPNGLVFVNGEWRLMYQHAPFAFNDPWDSNQYWGYAVSRDLVHWEHRGDAVRPYPAQRGLISGSGVVDVGNTAGFGANAHVICVCGGSPNGGGLLLWHSEDGKNYVPYEGNPVYSASPLGADPKVIWHKPTQRWIMVTHTVRDNCYCVVFSSSPDLKHWRHESDYFGDHTSKGRQRFLHECPGLEELKILGTDETAWVVWCAGPEYAVGSFDGHVFRPLEERLLWLAKKGTPYYAGQSFQNAPDGRCVYLPWYRITPAKSRYFTQALGVPTDLALRRTPMGLRLARTPVRELEALRDGASVDFSAFEGELAEMRVSADLDETAKLEMNLRGIPLVYDAKAQTLSIAGGESVPWAIERGRLRLRMYLDVAGLEVFSEDGIQCWPFIFVRADPSVRTLSARPSPGVSALRAEVWRLRPAPAR